MQDGQFHIEQEEPKRPPLPGLEQRNGKPLLPGVEKKKETGGLGSLIGGQVSETLLEGERGIKGIASQFKGRTEPSIAEIPIETIEDFNRQFRDITGKQKPLSLGSELPQIKKERERKEYETNRDVLENKLLPLQGAIMTGTITPQKLKEAYQSPDSKQFTKNLIASNLPEADVRGLDVELLDDIQFEKIASELQKKNRQTGILAQNQQEYNLDNEISEGIKKYTYGSISEVPSYQGADAPKKIDFSFGQINTSDPVEVYNAMKAAGKFPKMWDDKGKEINRDEFIQKMNTRVFQLKSQENIHQDIIKNGDKIFEAVKKVPVEWKKIMGEIPELSQQDNKYIQLGLNYIKDLEPGKYKVIMGAIDKEGKLSQQDYHELVTLGKDLSGFRDFKQGEIIRDDDRSFLTPELKTSYLSGWLSEEMKKRRIGINKFRVSTEKIKDVYKDAPEELKDEDALKKIILKEALGGQGIKKAGVLQEVGEFFEPMKNILGSFSVATTSPYKAYLEGKRLDKGQILLKQKDGSFADELPSNTWLNRTVGTFFQFLSQVAIARGLGVAAKGAINPALQKIHPSYGLTTGQAALSVGTPLSITLQTYGNEYLDFLEKTGNPNKAGLMAFVSSLGQAAIERMVLPDVKIADNISAAVLRKNFAKQVIDIIDNGGGKKQILNAAKEFIGKATKTMGLETSEEILQNNVNFLTESIASPNTAADRDIVKESIDIGSQMITDMALTSIIAGAAETKVKRNLSKAALNNIGVNSEQYLDMLSRQYQKGMIPKEQYDLATKIITLHGENVKNAPIRDANSELISADRQLEYAYQQTVSEVNRDIAEQQKDGVRKEYYKNKAAEADGIMRQIFYGEEGKNLPPKKDEEIQIDQDRDLEMEGEVTPAGAIQKAIESGEIKGANLEIAQKALSEGKAEQFMKEVAEQAQDETSNLGVDNYGLAMDNYGIEVVDMAVKMFPKETAVPSTTDKTGEQTQPSKPTTPEVSTVKTKEEGEGSGVVVHKSILNSDADLKGNKKEDWMQLREREIPISEIQDSREGSDMSLKEAIERVRDGKTSKTEGLPMLGKNKNGKYDVADGYHRIAEAIIRGDKTIKANVENLIDVRNALDEGKYQQAISEGRMTANDAKKIIESAGLEVPKDILEQSLKEQPSNETATIQEPTQSPQSKSPIQEGQATEGIASKKPGKFEEKARKIAEKIQQSELPDWLKADLPEGTQQSGASYDQLKKALADAVIEMGKLLDKGVEFSQAVKQAVQGLVNLQGEQNRDSIEKGFGQYYEEQTAEKGTPTTSTQKPNKQDGIKGVLNRLYESKNVPERARKGFEREGLIYTTSSQEEAAAVAEAIVENEGIDSAIQIAKSGDFDGDVNSLIFAKSLEKLAQLEKAAKTQQEAFEYADRFAEVAIEYDKAARTMGRFNAAINYFYEQSPLGVLLRANADNKGHFDKFSKPNNKSWDEFWEEIKDIPEVKGLIQSEVKEELKKERAEQRKTAREKTHKAIDNFIDTWTKKLSIKGSDDVKKMGVGLPELMKGLKVSMKAAYDAGVLLKDIIEDAVTKISEIINGDWDIEGFKASAEKMLLGSERKSALDKYKERLKKQIDELDKQIAEAKRKSANKNKTELDDEAKELVEKREEKKKELERVAPLKKDDEYMMKQLDKFRGKLKGLTESQKDEVIRNSYIHIIENGALEQKDLRKIIATAAGYGDLTPIQAAKLKQMVLDINAANELGKVWMQDKKPESENKFRDAQMAAAKAARDLSDMFDKKRDIPRLLNSLTQGLTLTGLNIVILNPLYNVVNNLAIRFPIAIINALVDVTARAFNKKYAKQFSTIFEQKTFFQQLKHGLSEGGLQVKTGLNRMDYMQKELYPDQIRPFKSMKDLKAYARGEKQLSKGQWWHRAMQIYPGTLAEFNFRMLNLFDKPQRFAAGGATAATYAKILGIPKNTMDFRVFMEFPREMAYEVYKKQYYDKYYSENISKGMDSKEAAENASKRSDEKAGAMADVVLNAIIQEGARSTFQQDNRFVNFLNWGKRGLFSDKGDNSEKASGVADLLQTTIISPYVKIPSNAYWSFFNLKHPPVAFLQAAYHWRKSVNAAKADNEVVASKQAREARYWLAHGITGIAWQSVAVSLIKAGIVIPGNDGDEPKKEREGERAYEEQGTINISKLFALLTGKNPKDVKKGTLVRLKWFGPMGMLFNSMARDYEELEPEQKESRNLFMANMLSIYDTDDLKELENGIFGNTSALFNALNSPTQGFQRYALNVINMYGNIIHPAAISQFERAMLPYYTAKRADNFMKQLHNDMADRSWLYRKLTGHYPPSKINIWGEPMKKPDSYMFRIFGFSSSNKDNFAQPIYEDAKKYNDIDFFPPAISKELNGIKLNSEQQEWLERYIGTERAKIASPYINDGARFEILNKSYSELGENIDIKKKLLEAIYSEGRENGLKLFYIKYPEFVPKKKDPVDTIDDKIIEIQRKIIKMK